MKNSITPLVAFALLISLITACNSSEQKEWAIALHGGAGTISQELPDTIKQQYYDGLEEAFAGWGTHFARWRISIRRR